jgi:hypothetical protein
MHIFFQELKNLGIRRKRKLYLHLSSTTIQIKHATCILGIDNLSGESQQGQEFSEAQGINPGPFDLASTNQK